MKRLLCTTALWSLTACLLMGGTDQWPQFRGPGGDGLSQAKGLPLTWSETSHVKWKTAIHGRAWSSPVLWDDQIWLSTATEDGRELSALCLDRNTGAVVRDFKLFDVENPQFAHKFNTYASPTPVIEKDRVYITFGSPGTACIDITSGTVLWTRRDLECNHFRGAGSSPILHGDLLILHFDGSDLQYLVALDKRTGETRWKTDRSIDFKDLGPDGKPDAEGDWRKAYATPHIATFDGRTVLLSQGAKAFYGYDPKTGRELFRIEERSGHSGSTRPVVGNGTIFFPTGFHPGKLLAVRPSPAGWDGSAPVVLDAADAEAAAEGLKLAWRVTRNVPNKPSLLLLNDLIFMVDDGGIATCLEAQSGREVWRERVGGNYSASPIAADGRVYFFNEEGKTVVVAASREFEKLAENTLDEGFMASPAVAGQSLFLRTRTHLYRIEE
jgi:outer membrane protein assembly factor BamB